MDKKQFLLSTVLSAVAVLGLWNFALAGGEGSIGQPVSYSAAECNAGEQLVECKYSPSGYLCGEYSYSDAKSFRFLASQPPLGFPGGVKYPSEKYCKPSTQGTSPTSGGAQTSQGTPSYGGESQKSSLLYWVIGGAALAIVIILVYGISKSRKK